MWVLVIWALGAGPDVKVIRFLPQAQCVAMANAVSSSSFVKATCVGPSGETINGEDRW